MSADLVQFLRARLDEDEGVAQSALELAPPGSSARTKWNTMPHGRRTSEFGIHPEAMLHSAMHGPVRVLAEVEAKRRIIAAHERRPMPKGEGADCAHCWGAVWPCPTLRLLALPYADHRDYRQEWRP